MDNPENNKSAWNEPFFKERTIGKCVSDGISLISNRFWKIIKLALPVIAFAAICITAVTFVFCNADKTLALQYLFQQPEKNHRYLFPDYANDPGVEQQKLYCT